MDIALFSLLLFFSIILFIVGFFKDQLVLIIFSGIAFILLGLFSFNGISYVSSTIIYDINASSTSVINIYSNWSHVMGNTSMSMGLVLGFLFVLFGLFLFLVGSILALQGKNKFILNGDDDSED